MFLLHSFHQKYVLSSLSLNRLWKGSHFGLAFSLPAPILLKTSIWVLLITVGALSPSVITLTVIFVHNISQKRMGHMYTPYIYILC